MPEKLKEERPCVIRRSSPRSLTQKRFEEFKREIRKKERDNERQKDRV